MSLGKAKKEKKRMGGSWCDWNRVDCESVQVFLEEENVQPWVKENIEEIV